MCQANPKCAAVVWNAGSDRWCNLKWHAAGRQTGKHGELLAVLRADQPAPAPAPPGRAFRPPPASQPDWLAQYNAGHLL